MDLLTGILIAELYRQDLFDGAALANMASRLDRAGDHEAADAIRAIPVANALEAPDARRAVMHIFDGGNKDD